MIPKRHSEKEKMLKERYKEKRRQRKGALGKGPRGKEEPAKRRDFFYPFLAHVTENQM